jgi:alkylation response protein AidB-like acyl-CoA dehydrogenase
VASGLGLALELSTAVVLPALDRWDPPGSFDGHVLDVTGLANDALARSEAALVVVARRGTIVAATVPTSSLEVRAVAGLDPELGLLEVTTPRDGTGLVPEVPLDPERWRSAVALARLAIAHELVGASRQMLELAREHALTRIQFGRPIASFQAIRHRLAETLVAIEMADAVADAAWLDGSWETAAMAKAVAGRAARTTSRHCQQVLAGIGFTTEHPLHRYIRRTLVLDGLFGTATTLTRALGHEVIERRQLPPLLPL